jgi:hypothetical protein
MMFSIGGWVVIAFMIYLIIVTARTVTKIWDPYDVLGVSMVSANGFWTSLWSSVTDNIAVCDREANQITLSQTVPHATSRQSEDRSCKESNCRLDQRALGRDHKGIQSSYRRRNPEKLPRIRTSRRKAEFQHWHCSAAIPYCRRKRQIYSPLLHFGSRHITPILCRQVVVWITKDYEGRCSRQQCWNSFPGIQRRY